MVGRSTFGGIYSALNSREINNLHQIFGEDGDVYELYEVSHANEMTLQQILDMASVTSSGEFYDTIAKSPEHAERIRKVRAEVAYLNSITRKLIRYGKRFNVGLVYPPLEEGQEKGTGLMGQPIYGS